MISEILKKECERILSNLFNNAVEINSSNSISGGCINSAVRIQTNVGNFFLKWNDAQRFPKMFEMEAKGLKLLGNTNTITIPEVIAYGEVGNLAYIILEFIESVKKKDFWKEFGYSLANMHKNTDDVFGLEHNNYIGSLAQYNNKHKSWTTFFIEERLEKQIIIAFDAGKINIAHHRKFQHLYTKLPDIFPNEQPALLHGDLWTGNFMVDNKGKACLVDPAVYYGHREADLAFTRLFGSFDAAFYAAYQAIFPIEKSFSDRCDIYNLYPLMVHVNLFGGGYLGSVKSILNRF